MHNNTVLLNVYQKLFRYSVWVLVFFFHTTAFCQTDSSYLHLKSEGDTLKRQIEQKPSTKSDKYYQRIKHISSRNKFLFLLYKNIFREPAVTYNTANEYQEAALEYKNYDGYFIRNVSIRNLKPFGTSVTDTTQNTSYLIDKAGNLIHIKTYKQLIKDISKIQEGEVFSAQKIYNSERVLRSTQYLLDCRIYVTAIDSCTVDVQIVTQDIWHWGADAGVDVIRASNIIFPYIPFTPTLNYGWVQNNNMFGLGHQFRYTQFMENNQYTGFRSGYTVPYIGKSLLRLQLEAITQIQYERYAGSIGRGFITPTTKYAGGFTYFYDKSINFLRIEQSNSRVIEYNLFDGWLGKSLRIPGLEVQHRMVLSARHSLLYFNNTILPRQDTFKLFQNRNTTLFSIGYSDRRFYRDLFIYGFGRTEDVPKGKSVSITVGIEESVFGQRPYTGVQFSQGNFYKEFGYLYFRNAVGTFWDRNSTTQTAWNSQINYFSKLYRISNIRFRQFINMSYTIGINRKPIENLFINDQLGLRGYFNSNVYGTQRAVLNTETVLYAPWEFLGFKMSPFVFADYVLLSTNSVFLADFIDYTGIGGGFRFRNERLAFNTFQIRFTYYPNQKGQQLYGLNSIPFYNLTDFDIGAPDIVGYR